MGALPGLNIRARTNIPAIAMQTKITNPVPTQIQALSVFFRDFGAAAFFAGWDLSLVWSAAGFSLGDSTTGGVETLAGVPGEASCGLTAG
jgi:hypothetical protein